jgi:type IV pilus assembly protein PilX
MSTAHTFSPPRHDLRRQRGVSLFIVLVVLLMVLILVLGGLMVTNMNESIVGNQADARRTYGAAEALVDAAQRDIRLNGRYCGSPQTGGTSTLPFGQSGTNYWFTPSTPAMVSPTAGPTAPAFGSIPVACTLRFPSAVGDYITMRSNNMPGLGNCGPSTSPFAGVCISNGPTDPNFLSNTVNTTGPTGVTGTEQWNSGGTNNSATYTQFVAAVDGAGTTGTAYGGAAQVGSVNLSQGIKGVYWVEVFQYTSSCPTCLHSSASGGPTPDPTYPFVFRITALAQGLKGDTASLLRTYYVPYPSTSTN